MGGAGIYYYFNHYKKAAVVPQAQKILADKEKLQNAASKAATELKKDGQAATATAAAVVAKAANDAKKEGEKIVETVK